jgi:hypothetical protein
LEEGWGRVQLPGALDRKYPNAPKEWHWQWVFPQENHWKNSKTGDEGRHHVHESIIQKAVGTLASPVEDMGINHHGFHILMAAQFLDRSDIIVALQKMRRERMSERMTNSSLC